MKPKFDDKKAQSILGKHVIIGVTINDHEENLIEQKQMHGEVIRASGNEGIVIKLKESGEEYKLPPDLDAFQIAPPGEYRFRSTGEVVVKPDLMTSWTIEKPAPDEKERIDDD